MRKILVICGLILMCMLYFVLVRTEFIQQDSKDKIGTLITKEIDELIKEYPNSPKTVIEAHNRLMQYGYSKDMKDSHVPVLVKGMRALYSEELLEGNSIEQQENMLFTELSNNNQKGLYIIGSELQDTLYKGENKVNITIKHFTTLRDINRNYELIQENSRWKINKWEDNLAD